MSVGRNEEEEEEKETDWRRGRSQTNKSELFFGISFVIQRKERHEDMSSIGSGVCLKISISVRN